jgi:nucleotide-binding universal stress UspA family protein
MVKKIAFSLFKIKERKKMPQKILIALDGSEISSRVVEFAAKTISENSFITLFSVIPNVDLLCELDPQFIKGFAPKQYPDYCRAIQDEKKQLLEKTLQAGRQQFLDAGFNAESISTKIEMMKYDVALTIIEEARTGCDLIVLGRRGHSGLKKFLLGSVSQKVLQTVKDISILIVE